MSDLDDGVIKLRGIPFAGKSEVSKFFGKDVAEYDGKLAFWKGIILSVQQREAVSRRHHLKFITGHYGSGKV